jgi:predicted alpha/beta hydrolase family esterase
MKTVFGLLTLGVVLAATPFDAEARPLHHHRDRTAAAQPQRSSADNFAARMSRLDALMGIKATTRTRSASADH